MRKRDRVKSLWQFYRAELAGPEFKIAASLLLLITICCLFFGNPSMLIVCVFSWGALLSEIFNIARREETDYRTANGLETNQ